MSEWFWKKVSIYAGWIAIAFLCALIIISANIEIKDLDLWLHLASGRYIAQTYQVPHTDIFSCTVSGKPWINHEWLFQVIIYSIHSLFGFEGLISLRVIVVGLIFVLLFILGANKEKQVGQIFFLILLAFVYQGRSTIRPDLLSLLFFVFYIYILALQLNRKGSLWLLFFIQVLWSNIHGFFIFGPVIVGISLMAEWIKRRIPLPYEWNDAGRLEDNEFKRLKYIFVAVLLACLLTPYFLEGFLYPFKVLFSLPGESKVFFEHVGELTRPIQAKTLFSLKHFLFYKILIIVSFCSFLFNRRRIDIGAVFFWFIFLFFSLSAARNILFFGAAAYLVFLTNTQYDSADRKLPFSLDLGKYRCIIPLLIKIAFIIWIAAHIGQISLRGYFDFDSYTRKSETGGISLRGYPTSAVDFLKRNRIQGNIYNDFNSGAYLLGRTFPNISVFIDGRTEVYGAQFFKRYKKIWQEGDQGLFEESVRLYNLSGVFLSSSHMKAAKTFIKNLYESKNWILVYFDYDAIIFLKDTEENKEWTQALAVDLEEWRPAQSDLLELGITNVTPYQHLNRATVFLNLEFLDKARWELNEAIRISPQYAKSYKMLGKIDVMEEKFGEAYQHLRTAKLLEPKDNETRYYLAVTFIEFDKLIDARKQCDRILQANPRNDKAMFLDSLIYAKEGNYSQSFSLLNKAHIIAPYNLQGLLKIADFLSTVKEYDGAVNVYKLALKTGKDEKSVHERIASCYRELGEDELAEKHLMAARNLVDGK